MASPLCFYLDYFLRWKPAANDRPEGHRAAYGFLALDAAKSILRQVIPIDNDSREETLSIIRLSASFLVRSRVRQPWNSSTARRATIQL